MAYGDQDDGFGAADFGGDPEAQSEAAAADVGGETGESRDFMSTSPISGGPGLPGDVTPAGGDYGTGMKGDIAPGDVDAYTRKGQYRSGVKGVGKVLAPAITGALVGSGPAGVVTGFFTGMYNQVRNAQKTVKEGVAAGYYPDEEAGWESVTRVGVEDRAAVEGNVAHGMPGREGPALPGLLTQGATPSTTPGTATTVPARYIEYMNSVPGSWEDLKAAQLENPGLTLVDWATEHATSNNQVIV